MAQTENGVGISYKLADGTMIWTRRDTWAEVQEDIRLIFGEEAEERLEAKLPAVWGGNAPPPQLSVVPPMSEGEAIAEAAQENQAFEICPKCGAYKNRWVEPGVSKKTGKPYPGFYGCSTPNCPGR